MTPIRTNKPLFFNSSGEPLNGTIWIGQPNVDPRPTANQKTVTFRDAGGSEFTASQPLNTVNGRISYNGKPIVALVDGEHSMLVFDSSGAQVDYSASVNSENEGGEVADFSEVTRVGLVLSDIKAFDVAVGEVVENVGKVTATDGLGETWLVVSATGSPADDETLIDFSNGLQGRVILNKPDYQEETVDIGGDFVSGSNVKIVRSGSQVTVTGVSFLSYTSGTDSADSDSGAIPEWARPTGTVSNIFYFLSSTPAAYRITIDSAGDLNISTRRTDTGAGYTTTATVTAPTISYSI